MATNHISIASFTALMASGGRLMCCISGTVPGESSVLLTWHEGIEGYDRGAAPRRTAEDGCPYVAFSVA